MPDIDFQRIELNLIPKKGDEPVIFYASQYETTRPFIADLMWGETVFAPGDDCWAEIDIRKNDDNLIVITDDVAIDNNEVSVILPVQALTCIGKNLGQVKIYAGEDQLIAALNFILEVQPDPLAGGVTSETAIDNLTEQIEEITQQVIGDDYYNKTEVDGLLAGKADQATTYTKSEVDSSLALKADKSDTYTKTQVDNALALKADASDVYTKSQVDTALASKADTSYVDSGLALKANASDVYTKAQTYSQAEVDALIDGIFPTFTALGPIASFITALTKPLVSVTANVSATTVTACGVNFYSNPPFSSWVTVSGYKKFTSITPENVPLIASFKDKDITVDISGCYFGFVDTAYTSGSVTEYRWSISNGNISSNLTNKSINSDTLCNSLLIYPNDETTFNKIMARYDIQIELGNTSTAYTPYNGQTVPVADADTLVTQSGVNNVFADVGDVTVQYKYMSM